MDTKPTKRTAASTSPPPKAKRLKLTQYQIRLDPAVLAQARAQAISETVRIGFPVSISAVLRKHISEGLAAAKESK